MTGSGNWQSMNKFGVTPIRRLAQRIFNDQAAGFTAVVPHSGAGGRAEALILRRRFTRVDLCGLKRYPFLHHTPVELIIRIVKTFGAIQTVVYHCAAIRSLDTGPSCMDGFLVGSL